MVKVKQQSDRPERPPLPAPVPGGNESVESLGSFIDRLMGDKRARDRATASLNRWTLLRFEEDGNPGPPADEEPQSGAPPPPPVPGGNESITKGDDPPGETR